MTGDSVQKPSVGRIVHVTVDPSRNNGADVAPAVITRVWGDNCVNLRVLYDGPPVAPEHHHRQDWLTSWPLHESREAMEAAHAEQAEQLGHVVTRSGAFWPPRV